MTDAQNRILRLLAEKDVGVLATSGKAGPHTSLMAFAYHAVAGVLLMMTARGSRKYENLTGSGLASVLVDSRDEAEMVGRGGVEALTMAAELVENASEDDALRAAFLEKHPQMQAFAARTDVVLLVMKPLSFLLLTGVDKAEFMLAEDFSKKMVDGEGS